MLARWDTESQRLRIWSSTQTSTGVRAAVAAKLGLALDERRRDHSRRRRRLRGQDQASVAGGGARPDGGARAGPAGEVHRGPARALHLLRARARRSSTTSRSASTTTGGILGLDVRFWHDHGAYTPYGLIVPIITSTQLLGPYKPGAYRVEFDSLYTNTVIVTPYRGRRPPAGLRSSWSGPWTRSPRARPGPGRGAGGQLHPARRDALRLGADLPGRPAADLRLRRLPGVAGQAQGARRLGRVRDVPRAARRRGAAASASAWPATSRAPASGPTRAATCSSRPPARSRSPPG